MTVLERPGSITSLNGAVLVNRKDLYPERSQASGYFTVWDKRSLFAMEANKMLILSI